MTADPSRTPGGSGGFDDAPPGWHRTVGHVAWDELDALGVLHHARFLVHAERAFSRLLDTMGYPYDPDPAVRPERHHVVARVEFTFTGPVDRPGPVEIGQRVAALGRTSLTLHTVITTPEDGTVVAEGTRTVVHVDRATRRPRAWSSRFRERLCAVLAGHRPQAGPETGTPIAEDTAAGTAEVGPWT